MHLDKFVPVGGWASSGRAVEEGDGADSWAGGWQRGVVRAAEALQTQQLLNLSEKNPAHRRDGLRPVAEHSPQPFGQ